MIEPPKFSTHNFHYKNDLILCVLFMSMVWLIFILDLWHYVGVPSKTQIFGDLRKTVRLIQKGTDVIHGYSYSYVMLLLGKTKLNILYFGLVMNVVFIVTAFFLMNPRRLYELIVAFAIMISPPVLLAIERGNDDLLAFTLLVFGGFFLRRKQLKWKYLSNLLFYIATVSQIYPVGSFCVNLIYARDRKYITTCAAMIVSLIAVWIYISMAGLIYTINRLPAVVSLPIGDLGFGGQYIFLLIGISDAKHITIIFGVIMLVVSALLSKRVEINTIETLEREFIYFIIGLSTLTFCFIMNTNYDYRCIFFIMLIPFLKKNTVKFTILRIGQKANQIIIGILLFILFNAYWVLLIKTVLVISELGLDKLQLFVERKQPLLKVAPSIYDSIWLMLNGMLEHSITWVLMTMLLSIAFKGLQHVAQEAPFPHSIRFRAKS